MKLLQKTISHYLVYSIAVLLIAIPVFYFVIQEIVREDVDEKLVATRELLKPSIEGEVLSCKGDQVRFLDADIRFSASTHTKIFDSISTVDVYDSVSRETVPHRQLVSNYFIGRKPYTLQIQISLVDNDELIQSIVIVQVLMLVALLAGLFIINRNLAKKVWKPFYTTLDKLRNYKVEKHQKLEFGRSAVSEFDDLNKSLADLTERTHQSYVSQKEFTENASHEMQTPLAILQGKIELLMQTNPLNEEQAMLLGELSDAGQRMGRLNKGLVLITKLENKQFSQVENIAVDDIVQRFLKDYEPQVLEKDITLVPLLNSGLKLSANKASIEILVRNLLANAIRHNQKGGTIKVTLEGSRLIIQNTGNSIALEADSIFKRFQKNSTDTDSIGLGLAIVQTICSINHYTLQYRFNGTEHIFEVDFNPAGS